MIRITSHSEAETHRAAQLLAVRLRGGDVVALYGPLGAGKTCFVRGLAEGLGCDPSQVASPTFVICAEYEPAQTEPSPMLAHLDGYRLTSPAELESIGLDELLRRRDMILAVEWADRCGDALPDDRINVELGHIDAQTREIVIMAQPALEDRLGLLRHAVAAAPSACPICRKPVTPFVQSFPFCSQRCRLVDLGKWLREGYRLTGGVGEGDAGGEPEPPG